MNKESSYLFSFFFLAICIWGQNQSFECFMFCGVVNKTASVWESIAEWTAVQYFFLVIQINLLSMN